ncbi:MAG: glycerol dehydrogenase [Chloroflexota bacterium]
MLSTTIFPGRYIQGAGALNTLGDELKRFGSKGFIICDPFVFKNLFPKFQPNLDAAFPYQVMEFAGECSDEEIERLGAIASQAGCDVIVGIGGGKTLDTAKAIAYNAKVPVAIVPTIASTDAPCSALSVIYHPDGAFKRYLVLPKNPDMVVVDTQVVADAPVRFLVSGMGDALATWFEAESCMKKYAGNMTGKVGSMTAYALARLCYDTLLGYGVAGKVSCAAHVVNPALERVVEANTLLSGLGFESGGLGAAHAIHNGLTGLEATHHFFHGEKVAIGTLASLFLTDKPASVIDEVYTFCENVGLPTTLAEIGLGDVSDADLLKVGAGATAPGETIHNEPIPVSAKTVFAALRCADAYGRRRKGL